MQNANGKMKIRKLKAKALMEGHKKLGKLQNDKLR
jgi:hypothetical protein